MVSFSWLSAGRVEVATTGWVEMRRFEHGTSDGRSERRVGLATRGSRKTGRRATTWLRELGASSRDEEESGCC